jgi:hypothetical protein
MATVAGAAGEHDSELAGEQRRLGQRGACRRCRLGLRRWLAGCLAAVWDACGSPAWPWRRR